MGPQSGIRNLNEAPELLFLTKDLISMFHKIWKWSCVYFPLISVSTSHLIIVLFWLPVLLPVACYLTFDPNTANSELYLTDRNRMATRVWSDHRPSGHPDRFERCPQLLCREGLLDSVYWEVVWRGGADIGVTYNSICRDGDAASCLLGCNNRSWSLECSEGSYTPSHDNKRFTSCSPEPFTHRVGVYLDWSAGSLSFYCVSQDAMVHLHTFTSTFTEPLYPGFWVWAYDGSVMLCQVELDWERQLQWRLIAGGVEGKEAFRAKTALYYNSAMGLRRWGRVVWGSGDIMKYNPESWVGATDGLSYVCNILCYYLLSRWSRGKLSNTDLAAWRWVALQQKLSSVQPSAGEMLCFLREVLRGGINELSPFKCMRGFERRLRWNHSSSMMHENVSKKDFMGAEEELMSITSRTLILDL